MPELPQERIEWYANQHLDHSAQIIGLEEQVKDLKDRLRRAVTNLRRIQGLLDELGDLDIEEGA